MTNKVTSKRTKTSDEWAYWSSELERRARQHAERSHIPHIPNLSDLPNIFIFRADGPYEYTPEEMERIEEARRQRKIAASALVAASYVVSGLIALGLLVRWW